MTMVLPVGGVRPPCRQPQLPPPSMPATLLTTTSAASYRTRPYSSYTSPVLNAATAAAARASSCVCLCVYVGGGGAHLEDWCFRVAVDGHNDLAVLHARNVLDGTTDANSNVQLRGHHLACLTNLKGRQQHPTHKSHPSAFIG